jgi:hypothetical protein
MERKIKEKQVDGQIKENRRNKEMGTNNRKNRRWRCRKGWIN